MYYLDDCGVYSCKVLYLFTQGHLLLLPNCVDSSHIPNCYSPIPPFSKLSKHAQMRYLKRTSKYSRCTTQRVLNLERELVDAKCKTDG
jgi:hypothetical protein